MAYVFADDEFFERSNFDLFRSYQKDNRLGYARVGLPASLSPL